MAFVCSAFFAWNQPLFSACNTKSQSPLRSCQLISEAMSEHKSDRHAVIVGLIFYSNNVSAKVLLGIGILCVLRPNGAASAALVQQDE